MRFLCSAELVGSQLAYAVSWRVGPNVSHGRLHAWAKNSRWETRKTMFSPSTWKEKTNKPPASFDSFASRKWESGTFFYMKFPGDLCIKDSQVISGRIFSFSCPKNPIFPLKTGVRTEDPKQHRNCELQVHSPLFIGGSNRWFLALTHSWGCKIRAPSRFFLSWSYNYSPYNWPNINM